MTMSADLRDRLKTAGVAGGAIYRDERPQGSPLPAVVALVASDPRPTTHDGRQALRETRVQLDCQAASRGAADDIAEAAIAAAEPAGIFGGTRFSRSFVDSQRTYSERSDAGVTTFVNSLDFLIWHEPAA